MVVISDKNSVEKKKVCLLIPAYTTIPSSFLMNFVKILSANMGKYIIEVVIQQDMPIDKARNMLVEIALSKNADYWLWMDTDNILPDNALDTLIKNMDDKKADLVSAIYFEKSKPYYPVIRQYHSGGFWKIENPPLGQIIEISGCGMGACLMRPDIFKKISYPWFKFNHETWGHKDIQLSEDLYFCRQLIKAGLKLYCNTGLVAAHIGSSVDAFEYMSMSSIRVETQQDRDELTEDLVKFTGRPESEVNLDVMVGEELIAKEWKEADPKTFEDEKVFYKQTNNYLYDLFKWHFTNRRQFDIELVTGIKSLKGVKTILDFGSGIGQNALMLAREGYDVTLADLDSKTLDFAEFRFNAHNVPYKVWRTDAMEDAPCEAYDVILCFDVLEHLPKDEMRKVIEKLAKLKHKDTHVLYTANFKKTSVHPMHYDMDKEYPEIMQKLLRKPSK